MRNILMRGPYSVLVLAVAFLSLILCGRVAWPLTLNVVGPGGEQVGGYKWMAEEDTTYHGTPGTRDANTLAVKFHSSYMRPVASGDETNSSDIALDSGKHYFISVLPKSGYTIGGAPVNPGQQSVTVVVNQLPLPTAQISVFAFHDNQPINNAPDLPQETGLADFSVLVFDGGGRYGMAGGQMTQDAFGNPLGTTYNPDGSVLSKGSGVIKTDATGRVLIKNLPPGKYGVQVVAPTGSGWVQTSTIEGTKTIDAWVKANEPQYFAEFGPPGPHVSIGFLKPMKDTTVLKGGASVSGKVVNQHMSRPPEYSFYNGAPFGFTTPWIGLNDMAAGSGKGVYAQKANSDGTFSITDIPPGNYQLVVWDDNLDLIIAFHGITITPGQTVLDLGEVPVFHWFTRLESRVFFDRNENGFRDCVTPSCDDPTKDDIGIPEIPVNLRFRDGTIYLSMPTDLTGYVPFDEVFPFFSWLVAEVDFTRLKATGATIVVDDGGPIDPDEGWNNPTWDLLNPQPQYDSSGAPLVNPNTGNNLSRTEVGQVLTEAFQGFIGQTSVIEWGRSNYAGGENGGISGVVTYASTRAEDDPRYAAADVWEPGIPRVQVVLYNDTDGDGKIDDLDGDGVVALADVDNYPFGWAQGGLKGLEDIKRAGGDANVFSSADALAITYTDSWDDNVPTGCQGEVFYSHGSPTDCYDGLRNFNQVRPGVFDGGYIFNGIPKGTYIVEAVSPITESGAAYQTLKEEDKNVTFGDTYTPSTLALAPSCVNYDENGGKGHLVPAELSLFPGTEAPYAGTYRPLCDRKQITLTDGQNGAVNFFMFTEVPISGHIFGFILDDITNEFDPNSPQFGEKYAPPWIPVSVRDWTGREISRVYSDEWGRYNALVPSTYTANVPTPSGYSASMITVCLNDPGPIPDPSDQAKYITDPYFNRQYSQFCYTFQYMPGATTYLDTPVIPIAASAGADEYPLDCEHPDGTPKIYSVSGPFGGPYVQSTGQQITIVSEGFVQVPNPVFDGSEGANPRTINRDYGFGATMGTVRIGQTALQIVSWTNDSITATVPTGARTGELKITRGDNAKASKIGVTVTVGAGTGSVISVQPGGSIQQAIDTANAGDLILVPPGLYEEMLVMWKPVRLQGWGAGSVVIKSANTPSEKLGQLREKITSIISSGAVSLLPGQEGCQGGACVDDFASEYGAGILVLAKSATQANGGFGPNPNARIDGFTITGSDNAGGLVVNGYAHYLEISNNMVVNNQGFYGGGIRIGHPYLSDEVNGAAVYQSGFNDNIWIHDNHITQNGGLDGFGGGVSINTGSDFYKVTSNFICGNFTLGEGAGVGHYGLSNYGTISNNTITFNESFNQGRTVSGGGIIISGGAPLTAGGLTPGSGTVKIVSNLIQGNSASAGDGGGIRTNYVNGQDVQASRNRPDRWHTVNIVNNIVVNNVAALAGGGISLQDTARANIVQNTISNNDSAATAGEAFAPGSPNRSTPQPAGIVSRAHSATLASAFGQAMPVRQYREFSNPLLANNIIRHNRSFYFVVDDTQDPPYYGFLPDVSTTDAVYWDLWVMGTATQRYLNPQYSILTDTTGYSATNIASDPMFVSEYYNGDRSNVVQPELTTAISAMPAFDEGGNYIDLSYGPLTLTGDYHIKTGSPAINRGNLSFIRPFADAVYDYDGQTRLNGTNPDIGADER